LLDELNAGKQRTNLLAETLATSLRGGRETIEQMDSPGLLDAIRRDWLEIAASVRAFHI